MARPSATDRLGRILSMVPWIASQDGPLISEVCRRFDITRDDLLADLDVVFVVGLYPYTPESLVDVDVDDDRVWINYTNFFERPLRLSRDEGLALLAAGVASKGQPGHDPEGPLARGSPRSPPCSASTSRRTSGWCWPTTRPSCSPRSTRRWPTVACCTSATSATPATSPPNATIEPLRRFATDGAWYLDAHCRSSGEHRVFRVDRITSVEPTDEHFEATEVPAGMVSFHADAALPASHGRAPGVGGVGGRAVPARGGGGPR